MKRTIIHTSAAIALLLGIAARTQDDLKRHHRSACHGLKPH